MVHNEGLKRPSSDNGNVPFSEYELYDLINDRGETKNIAAEKPKILQEMKTELEKFVQSCERSNAELDYTP